MDAATPRFDFILYQSTILAGSEQAIEEFPGSVGTAIVDEDEVGS